MAKKTPVHYAKRLFPTPSGVELRLMPVPAAMLLDLSSEEGKPQPPLKPIPDALGGAEEPDDTDPDYLASLARWYTENSAHILRLCILMGVESDPPADDPTLRKLRLIYPKADPDTLKLRWVQALIGDELETFIEAVVSQTSITEEGMELAAESDRFRDNR